MRTKARREPLHLLCGYARRARLVFSAVVTACLATMATAEVKSARFLDPTDRYAHGVLGDAIEWGALSVTTTDNRQLKLTLPLDRVFEVTIIVRNGTEPGWMHVRNGSLVKFLAIALKVDRNPVALFVKFIGSYTTSITVQVFRTARIQILNGTPARVVVFGTIFHAGNISFVPCLRLVFGSHPDALANDKIIVVVIRKTSR